jgi:hypothetical protein
MKLDKFYKLKNELETFSFERNFNPLSKTLYYFSFLGNIFLILFSYFFIKDVTNSIPELFPGQGAFFSIFIILFMTGYELFKRFTFEQFTLGVLRVKSITFNTIIGLLVSMLLVGGSFYLSLKGSHRLIDTSEIIEATTNQTITTQVDSIAKYYDGEIQFYRNQTARTRADRRYRDSIVADLQKTKDAKIQSIEQKVTSKTASKVDTLQENDFAFAMMVIFLELIILIGVAFSAFYKWTSYDEMKKTLSTPQFRQLDLNLKLLKLYYQNGRKKEQDPVLPKSKFTSLTNNAKINCSKKDIDSFIAMCGELEIVTGSRRKRVYNVPYEKAKELLENQESI